ncbi:hypothetical protein [Mycobacterium sp. 29Ha]|uniref:hypothetical protein n=1 Tax=Mycobacterium sp. 29Ha TaxID=2939268 RepID=UPI0029392F7C|nr:hypothetical protein [Mycobacterium sp. 29Ha]MDV3131370.1 hypothetical protein [Mycobacterium sp. 29Ha]
MTLDPAHPILNAQRLIDDIVAGRQTARLLTEELPTRAALEALRSISNRVLNYAARHGLIAVPGIDLPSCARDDICAKPTRARSALNPDPPSRAIETAVGTTAALNILSAPSLDEAAQRADWLIRGQNADTGPAELRSCVKDDPNAAAIVIKASAGRLGPELQLRYRVSTPTPTAPNLTGADAERIARALPREMWSDWSYELLRGVSRTTATRSALSIAVLLVGSTVRPVEACKLLGEDASANALNQRLWLLCGSDNWDVICSAATRLSDYLNRHNSPIDYHRRRSLDYSSLLGAEQWKVIARRIGDEVARDEKAAADVREYLIGRISGNPATSSPLVKTLLGRLLEGHDSVRLVSAADMLDDYAKRFLRLSDIDEPVIWSPPLQKLVSCAPQNSP